MREIFKLFQSGGSLAAIFYGILIAVIQHYYDIQVWLILVKFLKEGACGLIFIA